MMRMAMRGVLAFALVGAAASLAAADEPAKPMAAPMAAPKPTAEVQNAAKAMAGSWQCKGDMNAGPMGPGHKVAGTMTYKLDESHHWLVATYTGKKLADDPMPFSMTEYRIYDPSTQKWHS